MRLWIPALLAASAFISQPALAAPSATQPVTKPAPVDPERLVIARQLVIAFWPDGTIKQMMSSVSGMQTDMLSGMMDKTPQDLGIDKRKDSSGKTLGELAREKDPHFAERMAITNRVMMDEMGKLMGEMEPQLRETFAQIYARRFSKTELADILAFFRTPSGKSYAGQLMSVMSDPEYMKSMTTLMPKIMQAMPTIMAKVKEATAHLPPPPKDDQAAPTAEAPPST